MLTNCINCGAPLCGSKCNYCGAEYDGDKIKAEFDRADAQGVLRVGDKEYKVYIGRMEAESAWHNVGRDINGRIRREDVVLKHKFTLIEV